MFGYIGTTEISIHALRVEGDLLPVARENAFDISIHALRVEGDSRRSAARRPYILHFYPRPPGGGRRAISRSPSYPLFISIHALRVEGDGRAGHSCKGSARYFYPRPPGGGRRRREPSVSTTV